MGPNLRDMCDVLLSRESTLNCEKKNGVFEFLGGFLRPSSKETLSDRFYIIFLPTFSFKCGALSGMDFVDMCGYLQKP